MNFSKTTSYALKILNYMAEDDKKIYSAILLHKKLNIPWPYLRKLLTNLAKKGLIKSIQGRHGGFIMAKDTDSIYIADIVDAIEGMDMLSTCIMGFEKCPFDFQCVMHAVWEETRKQIINVLKNTSLAYIRNRS